MPAALRPAAPPPGNRLLAALSRAERALLAGALRAVTLRRGQVLLAPGEETAALILPEGGLVSLLLELPPWPGREVGLVGREGVVGLSALLGEPRSPFRAVVRIGGPAQRVGTAELRLLADRSANLRGLVRRLALAALLDAAAAAACHGAHPLEGRLARWLLTAADRVGPGLALTQEDLASSIGARRPSVNLVLAGFRDAGLVGLSRGRLAVLDAAGFAARACPCLAAARSLPGWPAPGGASPPPAGAPRGNGVSAG